MHRPIPHLLAVMAASVVLLLQACGDEMVDRIAILPGQLTAYDSGGLEILALRREAEARLGDAFDLREFHDRVLENGTIPLPQLRAHVEAWIAAEEV